MMIQSLIETPEDVARATAHQARLEAIMVEAGGIAGPGTLGAIEPSDTGVPTAV
jgi:hypothetical protein